MKVLFPFGYGLSYTTFAYSDLRLSADSIRDTDTVTVTFTVKNTGDRAGKTVAQLYVGDVEGYVNAVRPVKELKAFRKIALEPGESKEVSFTLDKRAFATWRSEIHDWWVESGDFCIAVGDSSDHLPLAATLRVESTVELPRHFDTNSIFMDLMADPKAKAILGPMLEKMFSAFSTPDENASEASQEAVSADMSLAMMQYMPIRGTLSFGGGAVSDEMLEALLQKIND